MRWKGLKNVRDILYFHAYVRGSTAAQLSLRAIWRKHVQNTLNYAAIHRHRSSNHYPHKSLPSDSSRSNSASWSLTSLGRADRSTPRSAIVGSAAACGMFAFFSDDNGYSSAWSFKNQGATSAVAVFTPSSWLPDTAMTEGTGGKLARGARQSRDQGWRLTGWRPRMTPGSLCCFTLN